jgi:hypothetical protein
MLGQNGPRQLRQLARGRIINAACDFVTPASRPQFLVFCWLFRKTAGETPALLKPPATSLLISNFPNKSS